MLLSMLAAIGPGSTAHAALDPTIAAVGDMGCSPWSPDYNAGNGTLTTCRQRDVSDLLVNPVPDALLVLGDNQYDEGQLDEYQMVYDNTFGRANSVVYPSLGNAEYDTRNAQGYFDYFAAAGVTARINGTGGADASHFDSGYYSFEIGGWHLIALNSNCAQIGACGAGSPQETWLQSDLAAHPNRCTLAYWHHPRWNTGELGDDSSTSAFWADLYNANADLVLNGHGNHHYERFPALSASGAADPNGIREFIVSTGGESHGTPPAGPGSSITTSEVSDYTSYGVLRLTLHPGGYDWQFAPAAGGTFTDSGSGTCHAADPHPPSAPTLSAAPGDATVHLSWTPQSSGGRPITGYKIYRGTSAGGETLLASVANVTSYDDGTAANGTRYYFRVAAVNSMGEGSKSHEVSAMPMPPPPPIPFPRAGTLDDFAGPAGALSANWRSPALADAGTVTIDAPGATRSGAGTGSAVWKASTFGADEEAYLTVPTLPATGQFAQVAVRASTTGASNLSCYFLRVTPATGTWDVRKKLNGGSSTSIATFNAPFAAGDAFGLRAYGSLLIVYRKPGLAPWTSLGTAMDTSIAGGGYISYSLGDTTARGGSFGGGTVLPLQRPSAPALAAAPGDNTIHLSWTTSSDGGAAITAYNLYRGTSPGGETLFKSLGSSPSYDDGSAANGTKYYYRMSAVNSVGEGGQSAEVPGTPVPSISVDDVSRTEGDTGSTSFTFTVSLSSTSSQTVTVDHHTQDGTAIAGSDYDQVAGTLTFSPGQVSKVVTVPVRGDTYVEPNESFTLLLSGPTAATIADDTGVGTIVNDDENYARPKGATPISASLVPAQRPCLAVNSSHGGGLSGGSCKPPAQTSPNLTAGTPDVNGAQSNFTGSVVVSVCTSATCGGSDVGIKANLSDVRCRSGVTPCNTTNSTAGADYTGQLELDLALRLTDKSNAVSAGGPATGTGTVQDLVIPATIPCTATTATTTGAKCSLATTANSLMPGMATGGARAIWQLGQILVKDAGPDGLVATADGATPFAVQGVFVP